MVTANLAELEEEFQEEEIRKVVWELGPNRPSGLDGFPLFFFRTFWMEVNDDLKWMLDEVYLGVIRLI